MFGCHNCSRKPQKNESYENSACAQCRAIQDPPLLSYWHDGGNEFRDPYAIDPADSGFGGDEALDYKEDLLCALSQTIRILLKIKERNPETFRVLEAKMAEPQLSYSKLAEKLSCRKQNILYHLKKALRLCPELSHALIIDTRRLNCRQSIIARAENSWHANADRNRLFL